MLKRGTKKIREINTQNNTYFVYDLDKDVLTGKRKRLYAHTLEELEEKIEKEEKERKQLIDKMKPKSTKLSDCINVCFQQILKTQRSNVELGRKVMLIKNTIRNSEIDIPIEEITVELMQDFFSKVSDIYLRKSVEELIETIRMTFDLYERKFDFDKIVINEKPVNGYIFTPEEYNTFIEFCLFDNCSTCGRNQIIILFCMFTGISLSNAKRMTMKDLDFENGLFTASGKTYSMDDKTKTWLKEQKMIGRLGKEDDDLVFVNSRGTSPSFSSVRVTMNNICIRLGLPKSLTGKTIPKSFVIWKLDQGKSLKDVADYLGTTPLLINRVYDEYKARQFLFK